MYTTYRYISLKQIMSIAVALLLIAGLVIGLMVRPVGATSLAGVSSNIAEVPGNTDTNFIMKVRAHNDGDLAALEVDHSLQGTLPEFTVYANAANPYGDDQADYVAAGLTVSYNPSLSEWTFEFDRNGSAWGVIDAAGDVSFYFALKDINGQTLWGTMNGTTADNTFAFDFVEGTGDELVYVPLEDAEGIDGTNDAAAPSPIVVPGVPNTSTVY